MHLNGKESIDWFLTVCGVVFVKLVDLNERGDVLMGMYCACGWKMTPVDQDGCQCDWNGWNSLFDYPPERKNIDKPCCSPERDGKYLVRIQTQCADRYETESNYCSIPREVCCGYTGKKLQVFWDGDDEDQPYAWKEI